MPGADSPPRSTRQRPVHRRRHLGAETIGFARAGAKESLWLIFYSRAARVSWWSCDTNRPSRGYDAAAPHRETGLDRAAAQIAEIGSSFSLLIEIFCSHPFVGHD